MRAIRKGAEPRALLDWKRQNATTPDILHYDGGGFPREAVRQSLLQEQSHLCAYTMKRLATLAECQQQGRDTGHSCHIEHILPQSRGVPAESIDYQNMVACFPAPNPKTACDYGADFKADYDPSQSLFVSPLSTEVERQFAFDSRGGVQGLTPAAEATIRHLNLNHRVLVQARQASIRGSLEPKAGKPLSAAQARRLAERVMQPDADNRLEPFCVAIASAARAHAERAERRASRLRKERTVP
ncbi:MAG: hypothetical protein A2486_13785 [Burkholderiales bacterium RIFOXYC12_FULL_65_23]|jgi:uncharacterized protein (TIGR02646 family)|uniref:hypothetical protein n=1 Tax=Malikia spinosa TaxID=86180 RepID=UPI0008BEFE2B|nr:hypothetical protein [Malikia spinosa]OGB69535.1 MAG: hypothetical protein A2486_13785 [Burkholderiales bacterium RIFOXYC12_FULL_65_23]